MPVDIASGTVFTAWDDFAFPGPWRIDWGRFYSTSNPASSPLGLGWQSFYFTNLREVPPAVAMVHDDGEITFVPDPATGAMVDHPHGMELFREGPSYRIWNWTYGLTYQFVKLPNDPTRWRMKSIVRRTGERTELQYDAAGRWTGLDQSPLRRLEISYDSQGHIDAVKLIEPGVPPVVLVRYRYDALRRLIAAEDASGAAIRYAYDDRHRLVKETNRLGGSFNFVYDADGRCVFSFGDGGFGEREFAYDIPARITRVRDRARHEWVYYWNADGQVVRDIDPLGGIRSSTFDFEGRLVLQESAIGTFLRLEYDAEGHLATVTDGANRAFAYSYNHLHLCIHRANPDGTTLTWEYDSRGNLSVRTDEMGSRWQYLRDGQGRLAAAITPNGHRTDLAYGSDGRWHELRDAYGFYRFAYDARGNLIERSDDLGTIERREYDIRSNLIAILNPDGSTFRFRYSADNTVTEDTDELGRTTRFTYDRIGSMLEKIHPDGSRVAMTHDVEGRLIALTNENGDIARFTFDANGLMVEQHFFDGRAEYYRFDGAGQLAEIERPDGVKIWQIHDDAGRVLERWAGPRLMARFVFDARERVELASSPGGTAAFAYDPAGRVLLDEQDGIAVRYSYDPEGNRTSIACDELPTGEIRFEYDLRRRLTRVSSGIEVLQEFEYDSSDRLLRRILPGSVVEQRSYDPSRRIAEQAVTGPTAVGLVNRKYRFHVADGLVEVSEPSTGAVRFDYDVRDRLTRQSGPGAAIESMSYDPAGNLTASARGAFNSSANRMLGGTGWRSVFDANGLPIARIDGALRTEFVYDTDERLIRVERPDGMKVEFEYDAYSRRTRRAVGGAETKFLWAGHQLLAERTAGGAVTVYLNHGFLPLGQWQTGTWYGVLADPLFRPRELVDSAGALAWKAEYDGFGRLRAESGAATGSPFRLCGQYADREIGLHYNRFRHYDPTTARFLQPDPIGIFGGLNEYFYRENPLGYLDPFGLKCGFVHFRVKVNPAVGSKADYITKRDAFNAAAANPAAKIPTKADYDANIRPAANREAAAARAGGGYTSATDADHPGDVRATGLLGQTLYPLDSGVNRSAGSQVGSQVRNDPAAFPSGQRTPMMDLVDDQGNIIS